jgi:hypothetical protein
MRRSTPGVHVLCLCLTRPGRHPKKSFPKILEVVSRPEFAQDHKSGLRSDRGPVVLCNFFEVAILEITIRIFKFVWEILPIQVTTHHTDLGRKSAPPLFLEDEKNFQKSATMVERRIGVEFQPRRPILEKCSHLRENRGVLMLFKTTRL